MNVVRRRHTLFARILLCIVTIQYILVTSAAAGDAGSAAGRIDPTALVGVLALRMQPKVDKPKQTTEATPVRPRPGWPIVRLLALSGGEPAGNWHAILSHAGRQYDVSTGDALQLRSSDGVRLNCIVERVSAAGIVLRGPAPLSSLTLE